MNKFRIRLVVFAHGLGSSGPADDARIDALQQGPRQPVPTEQVKSWSFAEHRATTRRSTPFCHEIMPAPGNGLWLWEGEQLVSAGGRTDYQPEPDAKLYGWRRLTSGELARFAVGEDLCAWPWRQS